ncbi:hypothetical protein [Actinomyces wuliandei]|uniref:hypothetical protein n=1 Tax=Actinomyces wuliandei TaxID=2057743 RepID=UPI00111B5A3F|nr:hypothetical protein [Actinomyces wuliandei]
MSDTPDDTSDEPPTTLLDPDTDDSDTTADTPVPPPGPASAIDWWALTPAQRLHELGRLRLFVGRLVTAYTLPSTIVPPCWELHEDAVRLLDALHRSYRTATLPGQTGDALISFHRDLALVRDELRTSFARYPCADHHDDHVYQASAQDWAADIATHGKASTTWRRAQAQAWAAYHHQLTTTHLQAPPP